ncbi:TetR/AcrR family transcriptional regulator [Brachybacterium sp. GCM10030268]|uniref:TetR/AcrR family transcriptional regulator n=1 Tax=Brachybacterium sp. GCM10030268 TaxID=3273382 RepID=UPI0036224D2C
MSASETANARPPRTPRAEARERTMRRIVELGNAQLAASGPAALSVREIARGLGMVSSAIYRYVSSRDELLTLLIVEAYSDLADAADEAVAGAGDDPRARFIALGEAMAAWAIAQPERWTLLYGTPVRDYAAPAETTNAAGTRTIGTVLAIAADASTAGSYDGAVPPGARPDMPPEVESLLAESLEEFGVGADAATAARAVTAWSGLIGIISAHVFAQLGPDAVAVGEKILDVQIPMLADLIAPR